MMKTCLLTFVGLFGVCGMASAASLTYDAATAGPWNAATSWKENAVPQQGDELVITGAVTLAASDAATAALATQITVCAESVLTVTNDELMVLNGFMQGKGKLVKLGAGELRFTRMDAKSATKDGNYYDYQLGGLVVSNGLVNYPREITRPGNGYYLGPVAVYAPGMLGVFGNCNCYLDSLTGDGTITNVTGTTWTQLRFMGTSTFDGLLTSPNLRVYTSANITFTNPKSTINHSEFAANGGTLGFTSFGSHAGPSTSGRNSTIKTRDSGGTIRYVGTVDEMTDQVFSYGRGNATQTSVFDAGPHGGITFTGWLSNGMDNSKWNWLVLAGDNERPMVVSNYFQGGLANYVTKRGTGTWHFADTDDNALKRTHRGVYAVEEGTLSFESIANTGVACALGPQDHLVANTNAYANIESSADYAFLLGTLTTEGTLAYTGASRAVSDRVLALKGTGRVKATGEGSLQLTGGAYAEGSGAKLVLDGDGTPPSYISNLRDGEQAVLDVVKEGSGTWTFGENIAFSGTLTVKEGTLAAAPQKGRFTWFKWTLRETGGGWARRNGESVGDSNVGAAELAFYDAQGNRLGVGTTFDKANVNNSSALQPGTATLQDITVQTYYDPRDLPNLFDDNGSNEWLLVPKGGVPRLDQSSTWFSVVVRLPDGAADMVAYDVCPYADANRNVCAWALYGSTDGREWTLLDERAYDKTTASMRWFSDGTAFATGAVRVLSDETDTTFGVTFPEVDESMFGLPTTLQTVVAPGATLVAGREDLKLPATLSLTNGGRYGAYTGFAVPASGRLDIVEGKPASWFRLTVKETMGGKRTREGNATSADNDGNVQMHEFALYSADGVRRNLGLTVDQSESELLPGRVRTLASSYNYYVDRDADKLFEDSLANSGWCVTKSGIPRLDNENSWLRLVMRLSEDVPEITSCDWCYLAGNNDRRSVSTWMLEASGDGVNWTTVVPDTTNTAVRAGNTWLSDGTAFAAGAKRTGLPLEDRAFCLTAGFSIADFAATIDLGGCTDTANFRNWKVYLNGEEMPGRFLVYSNGQLHSVATGTMLILR